MCGGRMVDAPCSRIGHIYRKFMPYTLPIKGGHDDWIMPENFTRSHTPFLTLGSD